MKLKLAISPCPNDTFIFDHLIHHNNNFDFEVILEDVEQLNKGALNNQYDIVKVSFATYLQLRDQYTLLKTGAALGHGVGPLLVGHSPVGNVDAESIRTILSDAVVAIPGKHTTAHLLLSDAFPAAANKKEMVFNEIENAVLENKVDYGLLIHEGRFTYKDKGLHLVKDLGEWWEETYSLPIPLGCILIKNEYAESLQEGIESAIYDSIRHGWSRYPQLSPFILQHAQEMSEDVMRSHIELYVNKESEGLSERALAAIEKLSQVYDQLNSL